VPPGVMLGMGAVVTKQSNLYRFSTFVGSPARMLKENVHLIKLLGNEKVNEIMEKYANS
jgi:hypothetical protein